MLCICPGLRFLTKKTKKEIKRIKDKIHEYSEATSLSALKELDKASSNPEFKKELDEYLHHEFGNDFDDVDNDYFQLTVLDGISDVISSNKKYYPETIENDRKFKAAAEEMFSFVDKKVNSYVSEFGDEPLSRFKNDDSKYSDVVKNLIHEEAHNHGLNYSYRYNLSGSILELAYDGAIDPDDYYTFEEYKKKYGCKK